MVSARLIRISATNTRPVLHQRTDTARPSRLSCIIRNADSKKKKGWETPALTLEGRGNDFVVFTRCFCCSQVFGVLYSIPVLLAPVFV